MNKTRQLRRPRIDGDGHLDDVDVRDVLPGEAATLAAAQEAFTNIKQHELAVIVGVRSALDGLLRRFDPNTLEHVVTYDDPVFFVKPFTTRRLFKRQIGDRILDHSCLENEKDQELLVPTLGDAGR